MKTTTLLDTQSNAEKNDNYKFSRKTIEESPFTMVGDDKGWFVAMGDNRITEYFEDELSLLDYVHDKPWDLIITVMMVVVDKMNNIDDIKQ